jgi:predicted MFS family arabinose efflux permease
MRAMALSFPIYLSVGLLQLGVPAFAVAEGSRSAAGLLLSVMAASSFVGGVVYGALRWGALPARQLQVILGLYGLSLLVICVGQTIALMIIVLVGVGLLNAPVCACQMQVAAERSPQEAINESLAWNTTIGLVAAAAGNMIGGIVVSHGGMTLLMVAATAPVLASFLIFLVLERRAQNAAV